MDDKIVTISRATGSLTFPANFMLVATMNPCPCGYFGDPVKECTYSPSIITRYRKCIPSTSPKLTNASVLISQPGGKSWDPIREPFRHQGP